MSYLTRALLVASFTFLFIAPQPAEAQVSVWTWADPYEFEYEETVTLHIDAAWNEELWGCWESWCLAEYAEVLAYSTTGLYAYFLDDVFWECCYAAWPLADDNPGEYMLETSYDVSVTIWYFDSDWGNYYPETDYGYTDVEPLGPEITGPNTVWWFNGETPSGYGTSVQLISSGGANTEWSVLS